MICDIYAMHQDGIEVLPEYLKVCAEVAVYLAWSPDCCEDHCGGHPLCDPCARLSYEGEHVARIESLASL